MKCIASAIILLTIILNNYLLLFCRYHTLATVIVKVKKGSGEYIHPLCPIRFYIIDSGTPASNRVVVPVAQTP